MKRSWVRYLVGTLLLLLVLGWLATGVFTVAQDEMGVVVRFGKFQRYAESGLRYRFPWPVEKAYVLNTAKSYPMSIGYLLVDEARGIPPLESQMQWLTGDTNLINIRMLFQYRIIDLKEYLFSTEEPRFLIRRAAEAALTENVGRMPVDELLTYGRAKLLVEIEQEVQKMLDHYGAGLILTELNIVAIEPPQRVRYEFNDVIAAQRERETAVIEADGYRSNLLAEIRGQAIQIREEAESVYEARVRQAEADARRFSDLLVEYRSNPEVVRDKLFFDAMRQLLPRLNVVLYPKGEDGQAPHMQFIR
jgi:modulator of FtsH protease HflK